MFNNIYKDKKVLITGHTGFKGTWLSLWLTLLGAKVYGYSLEPNTIPSMFFELRIDKKIEKSFIGNILDDKKLEKTIKDIKPVIIFHLAAQPLVRTSYYKPKLTYETNVIGTLNVLETARKCSSVKAIVNVTTDKCYENKEVKRGYKEDDPMGGYDMYSSSKGCVEIMSSSYRQSFLKESGYALATARAGNVIGGGDWALDRLIPDCIRAINKNEPIILRNPNSIRPWQFVLEPLSGYLLLGQKLLENGKQYAQGFNFGPDENSLLTVENITNSVIKYYGKGEIIVHKNDDLHEANFLMLNIEKAKNLLGWNPVFNTDFAIKSTVDWYKHFYFDNINMLNFSIEQIQHFSSLF